MFSMRFSNPAECVLFSLSIEFSLSETYVAPTDPLVPVVNELALNSLLSELRLAFQVR